MTNPTRLYAAMVQDARDGAPSPFWWFSLDDENYYETSGDPALYDPAHLRAEWSRLRHDAPAAEGGMSYRISILKRDIGRSSGCAGNVVTFADHPLK